MEKEDYRCNLLMETTGRRLINASSCYSIIFIEAPILGADLTRLSVEPLPKSTGRSLEYGGSLAFFIWTLRRHSTPIFWVLLEDPLRIPRGRVQGTLYPRYVHIEFTILPYLFRPQATQKKSKGTLEHINMSKD